MILDKQYMLGYNMQLEKKKEQKNTDTNCINYKYKKPIDKVRIGIW